MYTDVHCLALSSAMVSSSKGFLVIFYLHTLLYKTEKQKWLKTPRPLRPLRFYFYLTAEDAETAKDSETAFISSLIPITLRVLCALRGFIFN